MKGPWYTWAHRWCQCNLTEPDAVKWNTGFWKDFWKKNRIQGIIVNAGRTVAYFPSSDPGQYRSKYLGEHDLLNEIIHSAREEELAVIARMDISMGNADLYHAHPDWFYRDIQGQPMKLGERYLTCLSGGYFSEQIPRVMTEVIEKYRPDGIADNSWSGMVPLNSICYCDNCRKDFHRETGYELPEKEDFKDPVYRRWLAWNAKKREIIYEQYNKLISSIGGEDCLWMGMLFADPYNSVNHMIVSRPYGSIGIRRHTKAIVVDAQARISNFDQNRFNGMVLHETFDDDKTDRPIISVELVNAGEKACFIQENGYVRFIIPEIDRNELAVLKWEDEQ